MTNTEKEPIWITGDNRYLKPSEMSDEHLENAKSYLERRLPHLVVKQSSLLSFGGACNDMIECIENKTNYTRNWIAIFKNEIARREAVKPKLEPDSLSEIHRDLRVLYNKPRLMYLSAHKRMFGDIIDRLDKLLG